MRFPDRLKELRNEASISQTELGKMFNLSKQTISSYEKGGSFPSPETLQKLADYFKVSLDYLLGRNDKRNFGKSLSEKDKKDIQKDLDKIMEKLEKPEGLMFDGNPANEETLEAIKDALEFGMRQAKRINKKYTPNKYKKGD